MLRSVYGKVKNFFLLAAQTIAADTLTAVADLAGVQNFAFEVLIGAASFTGVNKLSLEVLHSDDGTTFVACAAEDLYSPVSGNVAKELTSAADQNKVHLIGYRGTKRYLKLNLNLQGALASVPVAVSGISTMPELMPS